MTLGSFVLCFFDKNLDAGSGHQYDHCFSRITVFSLGNWGGGVLPIMAYMGRLRPRKGYLFRIQVYIYVRISLLTISRK